MKDSKRKSIPQSRMLKFVLSICTVLIVATIFLFNSFAAYADLNSKYVVMLANSGKTKNKYINIDLSDGVYVSENPSTKYYCTVDVGGKVYNSISPSSGTKMTWYGSLDGKMQYRTWTSQGGSVSGSWGNNSNNTLTLSNVDVTASTPYIRLPKVYKTGYTFTGWSVKTETAYYYDGYRGYINAKGQSNPGIHLGNDGFYYMQVGAYSNIRSVKPTFSVNSYYLDLNGVLDGNWSGNINGYGTADVYVNGNLVANDVTDFYQSYSYGSTYQITDIKSTTGHTYNGVSSGSLSGTITGNTGVDLSFSTNKYYLDLNGFLDGINSGGLEDYGTADVYINGNLVANDVTDFYQSYSYGTTYQITDIKSTTGHTYTGVNSGNLSGSITGNTNIRLSFNTNSYTNGIGHWAGGFTKGEGNNGAKNMFNISNTSFNARYAETYSMNSNRATAIPKGFYLNNTFGSGSIEGSWKTYQIGTNVTQKANVMGFEYYYYPYTYSISYDLDGGINASNNPTSYNVLYGVTLQNPTRVGYTFDGWTDSSGNKITGINEGENATFSSPSDLYDKLSKRQTGNISLKANWINNAPVINAPIINNQDYDDNEIIPFLKDGVIVIQLNDNFTPLKYATATDIEDGDITKELKVTKNAVDTNVAGTYSVVYSVTDKGGKTTDKEIKVIVNDPPKLTCEDRYFFQNQEVDKTELLKKATCQDYEDGNISSQIKIVSIKYYDHEDKDVDTLNTSLLGEYDIVYTITDSMKKTEKCTAKLFVCGDKIIENSKYTKSPRYIATISLNTLKENSIWKTNSIYTNTLLTSLNRTTPIKTIKINKNTYTNAKEFVNGNKPSENANKRFLDAFMR